MALCHYIECFETWDGTEGGKGATDDFQWQIYNVTENHGIPPSAILEVACVNEYPTIEYMIGLRSTASSGQADSFHRFDLAEAEDGDTYVVMHVQLDSSGCLQYFIEYYNRLHFDILGYWLGGVYVDKFEQFNPSTTGIWENYALDQHGVSGGQIAEIALCNDAVFEPISLTLGVRASGSTEDRRFGIKEAEAGGIECLSVFVSPSGATAGIDIWSINIYEGSFYLLGYFSVPPAEYNEINVNFPVPEIENDWTEFNVGASGVPSNSVAQFAIRQQVADNIIVGVRETDSNIDNRKLNIDRQDVGLYSPSWVGIHSNVDDDGKLEYFCNDTSDEPFYVTIGYWDNFVNSTIPFSENNNMYCFIMGHNPYAHYFEAFSDTTISTPISGWVTEDLSSYIHPDAFDQGNIVAEILIRNRASFDALIGGVRSDGSSLDRKFEIHESYGLSTTIETISLHVPVSSSGTIETYGSHDTYIDNRLVGYWVGCEYVDLIGTSFTAGATSGWTQHNLDTYGVPPGKIAEILIANSGQMFPHSGGVRVVGSQIDRLVRPASLRYNSGDTWEGSTYATMSVVTSGINSTIEVYTEDDNEITFYVVGYWENPPGDYIELCEITVPHSATEQWKNLDITQYNVPTNTVAEMIIGNRIPPESQSIGVRELGSTFDRHETWAKFSVWGGESSGICGDRLQVNTLSGTIETYHSSYYSFYDGWYFGIFGYWDNLHRIPVSTSGQSTLTITGHQTYSSDADLFLHVWDKSFYVHYIEDFRTWTPSIKDAWEEKDLSAWVPNEDLITAEILIANSNAVNDNYWIAGVRTAGSSLDRKYNLVWADTDGGSSALTLHVQLSGGKLECYAPSGVDFYMMGYWIGAEYVELADSFVSSPVDTWNNRDLDVYGVPSGAIVEIAAGGAWWGVDLGMRSVGSSDNRVFQVCDGNHNYDRECYWTSFLQTSGINATIQSFASNYTFDHHFYVVGYWTTPPGDYTDVFQSNEGDPTSDGVWEQVNISGVPSGSVASFGLANSDNANSRFLGIRQIGHSLERRINLRSVVNITFDAVQCCHANISSDAEAYSEDAVGSYDDITLLGYWDNFTELPIDLAASGNLYICGTISCTGSSNLYIYGHQPFDSSGSYPSGVPFSIYGVQLASTDLFTYGFDAHQASGDLFIHGVYDYATNAEDCPAYPSGVLLYTKGSGIIPASGHCNLVIAGVGTHETSSDLFTHGYTSHVASSDLFIKVPELATSSLNMVVYNLVDAGPGLIRETNAVFYLRYYHDGLGAAGSIKEFINDQMLCIPNTLFQHSYFIGVSGKTIDHVNDSILVEPFVPTFGDGTYPHYNDLGGLNYREQMDTDYRTVGGGWQSTKLGYYEDTKYKQNICGTVEDYGYPGSGSLATVFWMSGAHTSGNVAEVGWFRKNLPEELDIALASHTLGIRIESESGITVITNVRDVPYEQPSGGGLWWGGTTHYGIPSGSDWTWNPEVTELYRTWEEEWPTVYIGHNPIAFVALHADFIASGVDGNHPNHMKVYLSLDGQPWTYIGSGLTGPPASSLYSYSNPTNQRAENSVGVRQQGVNITGGIIPAEMGGVKQGSIVLSENVLWTDAGRFTTDELKDLYSIVDTYNRPLDEYRPTIIPPSTYIQRTVGMFSYNPTIPVVGYNPGEICSGLRVTIEVGLGAYGADASAYLLEETPPSGFYIGNIQPTTISTYYSQGARPNGGQQIFHDPQSGIIQPYDDELNLNSYGASIRWVNHDNHPEINQRRSPTPTSIYSYDLFPIHYHGVPRVDDFAFAGSGVFFGGSIGSGIFVVETTGDITGTTSGLTGGLVSRGCNLYIQGPLQNTETADLYLRTQESFTSAYIGTSSRTPELTDFIFAADGAAAIESMAGIEYGPPLYIKGPLQYEDTCTFVMFGPVANDVDFYIQGSVHVDTSGDYPSGVLLRIGDGHEPSVTSGDLYIQGPTPWSGDFYMHTRAGAFEPPIDLFTIGSEPYSGGVSGYIKGPEFICSSGSFSYPGDPNDFVYPYGAPSPTLYTYGYDNASGTCSLFIGPGRQWDSWTLYLKTDDNDETETLNLFIHGFTPASGSSGVNQTFNNVGFYLEAADADYPYTAGGTEVWTLFMKTQSGNLTSDKAWTMFLKADFTIPATCSIYMYGHASGEAAHGNEINGSIGLVCSVNPDDPTRIGFRPHDAHDDPWNLFLKCDPGWFGIATLYMSGAVPTLYAASGILFVEGLFEQKTDTIPLYLMGVSGMFNNGPSGLYLFLNAGTLVYNTSGNLYVHGY